jgi:hypothetical protein
VTAQALGAFEHDHAVPEVAQANRGVRAGAASAQDAHVTMNGGAGSVRVLRAELRRQRRSRRRRQYLENLPPRYPHRASSLL